MTTMEPPTVWGAMPTATEIWKAVKVDRIVAITAIITTGVVIMGILALVGVVAYTGGDTTVVAGAISLAIGALIKPAIDLFRKSRSTASEE